MQYQIIKTYSDLNRWFIASNNHTDRIIACDTETTSLDYLTQDLCGISFCNGESACYVDIIENPNRKWLLKRIKQEFSFQTKGLAGQEPQIITGIFQNAVYDLKVLTKFNLLPNKFPPIKIWDTMIAGQLLNENDTVSLDDLGERYLGTGKTEKWEEAISEGFHSKRFYDYALRDPVVTYKLYEVFKPILTEQGLDKVFYDIELPFVYVLRDLEINGILVDQKRLSQLHTKVTSILNKLVIELYDAGDIEYHKQQLLDGTEEIIATVDFNSPQQMSRFIIDKLGIELTEKTKTGYSVKGSVLEGIRNQHPFIDLLLKYRDAETLNNKFISKLPSYIQDDGRIRTSFRNTLVTGRLSSSNPPMQQLPRDNTGPLPVRECFIAPKGKVLVVVDYSGQELRVLAEESGDPTMIDAFYKNQDLHLTTANKFFNLNIPDEVLISTHPEHEAVKKKFKSERDKSKIINFGISYGKSAYGFAKDWNISQDEAQIFIDNYFAALPAVKVWIENVKLELKQNSYVTLFSGRRRRFPDYYKADKWGKERMERQATNVKIQGSSADMIKYSTGFILQEIYNHPEWECIVVLQVHDELVFEVKKEYVDEFCGVIKKIMSTKIPWSNIIPYSVDIGIGVSYSEAKK